MITWDDMESGQDRFTTMYLGTIQSAKQDVNFRRKTRAEYEAKQRQPAARDYTLNTADIQGAQANTTFEAKLSTGERHNRPTFYTPNDIAGAQPNVLIPRHVNRETFSLKNDDIEGAQPLKNRMRITRQTNPLNPVYKLPSVDIRPITPPKFIRDSMRVDDIDGARPKPSPALDRKTRDVMTLYDDVIGRGSGYGLPPRKGPTDNSLRAKDINNDGIFKTRRVTNPLSPRYDYDRSDIVTEPIGSLDGMNKPRKLPALRKDRPLFSLRTDDIPNMKIPGTHQQYLGRTFPVHRRQYRDNTKIDDIEGASPSSNYTTFFKKSTRKTDPVNPQYRPFWDTGADRLPGMSGPLARPSRRRSVSTKKTRPGLIA